MWKAYKDFYIAETTKKSSICFFFFMPDLLNGKKMYFKTSVYFIDVG